MEPRPTDKRFLFSGRLSNRHRHGHHDPRAESNSAEQQRTIRRYMLSASSDRTRPVNLAAVAPEAGSESGMQRRLRP